MSQRAIEVKVGALILTALLILAGLIVALGGVSFEPTFTVYVDFENPGGLQAGAPVRLAGIKVGKVEEVRFRGATADPKTGELLPPIRVVTELEQRYQTAIFENSRWFVTTQGVLGEQYLAIEPGTPDKKVLADGAVVNGISPPRLDLLLSEGYELLHRAYVGITHNEEKLQETFDGLHRTLTGTGKFFDEHDQEIDEIVGNLSSLSHEANETLKSARKRYVDGPQVTRIFNNVERTTSTLNRDLGPLLGESRALVADARRVTSALGSSEQIQAYKNITKDLGVTAANAKQLSGDARQVMSHIKRGEGTAGALVMDEALYDDLQELVRDLKHNPWKFFWRE